MADISDVETAFVTLISAALYPSGTGNPSVISAPVRVYRGWPNARALDADLKVGIVNVTVFSRSGMTTNTTRWPDTWYETLPAATISVTTASTTATFAGAAGVAQNCGIRLNGRAYVYSALSTDTPNTVASALAALVPGASAVGAVVTVPYTPDFLARVEPIGSATIQPRRQKQGFLISVWAPTTALRDAASAAVDVALAMTNFLSFPDNSVGRLLYTGVIVNDAPTKDALWRRDMTYTVEYPTTYTVAAASMLFGGGNLTLGSAGGVTRVFGDVSPLMTPPGFLPSLNFSTAPNSAFTGVV